MQNIFNGFNSMSEGNQKEIVFYVEANPPKIEIKIIKRT